MKGPWIVAILVLAFGCSSHVRISPYGISGRVPWSVEKDQLPRKYKNPAEREGNIHIIYRIHTPFPWRTVEVQLKDVLRENGIPLQKVTRLNYELKSTAGDVALSFIPFMSTKTLLIEGYYQE